MSSARSDTPAFIPFALNEAHAMAALGAVRFALNMAENNLMADMPIMQEKIANLRDAEAAMVGSIQRAGFVVV